ncbi:hypothetical protein D3C87_2072260 [compost metagenome]
MQQPAEGLFDERGLGDRHRLPAHQDLVDLKARFPVGLGQPGEQLKRGVGLAQPRKPGD